MNSDGWEIDRLIKQHLWNENQNLKETNQRYKEEISKLWDERDDLYERIYKAVDYVTLYQECLKEHNGDWINYQDGFKPRLINILEGKENE